MTNYITPTQVAITIRSVLERCEAHTWVKALTALVAEFAIGFFPDSPDAQRAFIRQCVPDEEKESPIRCCYLRPSPQYPKGDIRRQCEHAAEWCIWENGTHPSEVTYACDVHLPRLLGTTGGHFEFMVWPIKVELEGVEDETLFSEPDPFPIGYFATTGAEPLHGVPGAENVIRLSDHFSPEDEVEEEIPFYERSVLSPEEAERLLSEDSPCRQRAEAMDALEKALRTGLEVVLAMQKGQR